MARKGLCLYKDHVPEHRPFLTGQMPGRGMFPLGVYFRSDAKTGERVRLANNVFVGGHVSLLHVSMWAGELHERTRVPAIVARAAFVDGGAQVMPCKKTTTKNQQKRQK